MATTIVTPSTIRRMPIGDKIVFGRFSLKHVSRDSYILRDTDVTERARWGNAEEIIEDVDHVMAWDQLPAPSGPSW